MKNIDRSIKIIILSIILVGLFSNIIIKDIFAYSPEEGEKIEQYIEKNDSYLSAEEKDNLRNLADKLSRYEVLSQEERDYIRDSELKVVRAKLGDAQFEEYSKLIQKRESGSTEFQQPERFRLYQLEKLLE